jgi:hypothetical protein
VTPGEITISWSILLLLLLFRLLRMVLNSFLKLSFRKPYRTGLVQALAIPEKLRN